MDDHDLAMTASKQPVERLRQAQLGEKVLSGRVALVTGASRGIGRAIALGLAKAGAAVAVGARNREALESVRCEVADLGVECFAGLIDVTAADSVESFAGQVLGSLGAVDILVNNAGIYKTEPVRGHSLAVWRKVLDTNLTGALLACRQVLDAMIDRRWGRIVNISSVSGKVAEIYGAAYSASKFGLIGLTQALALEVAGFGITVNAVCPGWVDTDMARAQLTDENWCTLNAIDRSQSLDIARLSVPQGRLIDPEEVASLVVYLCSPEARGITGQAINICGGLVLH